jgi:hypothetical protein
MANFQKRSLLQIILLTICTFGIYSIYWGVVTKRELNQAGAHVPNSFLMILPIINLYFWYRYAQAYASIVRRNQDRSETLIYLFIACIPTLFRSTGLARILTSDLDHITSNLMLVFSKSVYNISILSPKMSINIAFMISYLVAVALICTKVYIFQEGYNNYQN